MPTLRTNTREPAEEPARFYLSRSSLRPRVVQKRSGYHRVQAKCAAWSYERTTLGLNSNDGAFVCHTNCPVTRCGPNFLEKCSKSLPHLELGAPEHPAFSLILTTQKRRAGGYMEESNYAIRNHHPRLTFAQSHRPCCARPLPEHSRPHHPRPQGCAMANAFLRPRSHRSPAFSTTSI